jgi:hypothetical protein
MAGSCVKVSGAGLIPAPIRRLLHHRLVAWISRQLTAEHPHHFLSRALAQIQQGSVGRESDMGREHCSGLCAQFGRHFRLGFQHIQARSGKMPLRSAPMTAAVSTTPPRLTLMMIPPGRISAILGEGGVNDHDVALAEELRQSDELQVPSAPRVKMRPTTKGRTCSAARLVFRPALYL